MRTPKNVTTYPMHKNYQNPLICILGELHVKFTNLFAEKFYNEHPNKFNMLGLSQMLSYYRVENVGLKIDPSEKEKVISELETPYIPFCGSYYVIVIKKTSQTISYIWNEKKIDVDINLFLDMWSGEILIPEANSDSIEPDYVKHKKNEILQKGINVLLVLSLLVGIAISSYIFPLFIDFQISYILSVLFTGCGLLTSILLLKKQMHIQSTYADKVCTLLKHGDCNNILELDVARFLGIISWSEIGAGYFVGNLIILLYLPALIPILFAVNIFTLPYTFWSVWYQKTRAKQWCVLCLFVQAILWIIFIIGCSSGVIKQLSFNFTNFLFAFCLYCVSILIAHIVAGNFTSKKLLESTTQELKSLKTSEDVLQTLLSAQTRYPVSKNISKILFGNKDADILVTILLNPHCNPCAKLHKKIDSLLDEKESSLCIQFVLTAFNADLEPSSKALIECYFKYPGKAHEIYKEWFQSGRFNKDKFFRKYNLLAAPEPDVDTEYGKHRAWGKEVGLFATPTVLVNGYILPSNYEVADLIYFKHIDI